MGPKRVGRRVPLVGFFLVSFIKKSSFLEITGLNKLYNFIFSP